MGACCGVEIRKILGIFMLLLGEKYTATIVGRYRRSLDVLKNFANFTGKQLCWSLFLIKMQLQHRSFPVKIAKFL